MSQRECFAVKTPSRFSLAKHYLGIRSYSKNLSVMRTNHWEQYIKTLPEPKHKQFLSRQTSQGLRITLKNALDLTTTLLTQGFPYVLTGKFCQDHLEVDFASSSFD